VAEEHPAFNVLRYLFTGRRESPKRAVRLTCRPVGSEVGDAPSASRRRLLKGVCRTEARGVALALQGQLDFDGQ
jgi:hypothetical protein